MNCGCLLHRIPLCSRKMLTKSGYEILDSLMPESTNFAVFLLANFDLSVYTALNPERLIKFGINRGYGVPRTQLNMINKVDELVSAGFLEYGPFVKGWGRKPTPTVRIRQHLVLTRNVIRKARNSKKAREERAALTAPFSATLASLPQAASSRQTTS